MAEGLGQDSAMYRFVFACLVLALMTLAGWADGQNGLRDPESLDSTTLTILQSKPKPTDAIIQMSASETDFPVTPNDVQNNKVFNIVVIGDSIAWGAGLTKNEKYSYLVAKWIAEQAGRPVNVKVLAHTGATLKEWTDDPETQYPDIPSSNPTLFEQVDRISNPDDVDFVLVSGGANDVDLRELNSLDLGFTGSTLEDIQTNSWDKIEIPMYELLKKLSNKCPNARIIVTGYYSAISMESKGLTEFYKAFAPESQAFDRYKNADETKQLNELSAKANAFYERSNLALNSAKMRINEESGQNRIEFVQIAFPSDKSYGTDDSWLWKIEGTEGNYRTDDHKYEIRASLAGTICRLIGRMLVCDNPGESKLAAVGHPNVGGSGEYNRSIVQKISVCWPDWLHPMVLGFEVSTDSVKTGESVEINYKISSNCSKGLKQAELWRKSESDDWQQINTIELTGKTGIASGSFTDTPLTPGKYWYGMHVVDDAGNWNDERNSKANRPASRFEPLQVEVTDSESEKPMASDKTFGSTDSNLALKGEIYYLDEGASSIPDFSGLTPIGTIYADVLDIPSRSFDSGFPGVTERFEWFAIRYTGTFEIGQEGKYGFRLLSDDGSRLIIDGNLIIDNDGQHSPNSVSGEVYLTQGPHSIEVDYFQGPRYDIALQLFWTPPGQSESIFNGKAQALTDLTPPTVESFQVSPQSVKIGEATSITYIMSDTGGSALKQVELWRKNETTNWQQISTNSLAGELSQSSGSFTDSPPSPGKYWYGAHVVDNAGNWNDERNSNIKGMPNIFEPVEVDVSEAATIEPTTVSAWGAAKCTGLHTSISSPKSMAFSPDGKILAIGGYDGKVVLWDVASQTEFADLMGHSSTVRSVAFSPDGKILASGSDDNTIKLWDVQSETEIATLSGHYGSVASVAFSPDGQTLAAGCGGHQIKLWDIASKTNTATLQARYFVTSVAFSPDGSLLAVGVGYTNIVLWDAASKTEVSELNGISPESVAFSPSGRILASSGEDGKVMLWDMASRTEIATFIHAATDLQGFSCCVRSVAFSPDGKILASGGDDGKVKLWDVASRTEIAVIYQASADSKGNLGFVQRVAFSPDGKTLASLINDNTLSLCKVD